MEAKNMGKKYLSFCENKNKCGVCPERQWFKTLIYMKSTRAINTLTRCMTVWTKFVKIFIRRVFMTQYWAWVPE